MHQPLTVPEVTDRIAECQRRIDDLKLDKGHITRPITNVAIRRMVRQQQNHLRHLNNLKQKLIQEFNDEIASTQSENQHPR